MRKDKPMKEWSRGMMMILVMTAVLLGWSGTARADLVEIPGLSYKVNTLLAENLKGFSGRKIHVTMNSGNIFVGVVREVGKGLLHLEKIEGKEFFDALIRIEDISAIEVRFREYQR